MDYEAGQRTHMKKCTFCGVEPATGIIQKPLVEDAWFFNCDKCGNMVKIRQSFE